MTYLKDEPDNWAGRDTERTVSSWTVGTLSIHVTDRAHVLVTRQAGDIIARLADPAQLAELADVLEHARTKQAHVARKLYPSPLRQAVHNRLQAGSHSFAALLTSEESAHDLRAELRRMTEDGEVTIQPPSGPDGLAKYKLA